MTLTRQTFLFLALAVAFSWVAGFGSQIVAGMLGANPGGMIRYISTALAVLGPTFAALVLILKSGESARQWLVRDLEGSRIGWWWLAVPAATFLTTLAGFWLAGTGLPGDAAPNVSQLIFLFGFSVVVVGVLEEMGWRGWLARNWLGRAAPLNASIVVAAAWTIWHLPKMLSSVEMALALAILCLTLSAILTWFWNRMKGRTLLTALTHGSVNAPILWLETHLDPASAFRGFTYTIGIYAGFAALLIASDWTWWRTRPSASAPGRGGRAIP